MMPEVDVQSIIDKLNRLTPESIRALSDQDRLKLQVRVDRLHKMVIEELEKRK